MIKNFGMMTFGVSTIITGVIMVSGGITFLREGFQR